MKVLMIGGDKRSLDPATEAGKRFALQRAAVDELALFVWPQVHSRRDIMRAAYAFPYDVVTAQDPYFRGLLAWRVARRTGAKLNIQVHTDLSAHSLFRRLLGRFVLKRADSIRVVTEDIKKQVERLHGKGTIHVLPVHVDLEPYRNLMHHKHPRYFRSILWMGRFEPEKNPLVALEVLRAARKDGIDACLMLLGDGSLKKALAHAAQDFKKCVEMPGWVNPAPYLAMADVVVSSSDHESFGVSIIQALAAGVPVVSPDYGVAKEAGAIVVPRDKLIQTTLEVLRSGKRVSLKMSIPQAKAWAHAWVETL